MIDCPHCKGTGTCINDNGGSCGTCLSAEKVPEGSNVIVCSICKGKGAFSTVETSFQTAYPFILIVFIMSAFYLYVALSTKDASKFDTVFPLVSSLTTMVVTFFFTSPKK